MAEIEKVKPAKTVSTQDGYIWTVYDPKDTSIQIVGLESRSTGLQTFTPLVNPSKRGASVKGWLAARQSRAGGSTPDIAFQMQEKGVDPDQKLEETFRGYGHGSVADGARLDVSFFQSPLHLPLVVFNLGAINSGQENSTRYQPKFGRSNLSPLANYLDGPINPQLDEAYLALGQLSLDNFNKWRPTLTNAFGAYFKVDESGKAALTSRVLDCCRFFLLMGQQNGFSFETSARDFSRIIGTLKASPIDFYNKAGAQVERLLTPSLDEEKELGYLAEAPSLIRHTEAATLVNQNLGNLKRLLESDDHFLKTIRPDKTFRGQQPQTTALISDQIDDKIVTQYILNLYPGIDAAKLMTWVKDQDPTTKLKIGQTIFNGHDCYRDLPVMAETTGLTLQFDAGLGEIRDFNRHKAWSRFLNLPLLYGQKWNKDTFDQILSPGYTLPLYLTDVDQFMDLGKEFSKDLGAYYEKLNDFTKLLTAEYGPQTDYTLLVNLLPLAHRVKLFMHGDLRQSVYFTDRRSRPGGHINYRMLAYQANQLIAESTPYFKAIELPNKPDPNSRSEFLDRS